MPELLESLVHLVLFTTTYLIAVQTAKDFIPRNFQCVSDTADDIDPRIRCASFDSLDIAAVNFRKFRKVILRQITLHSQAIDVFSKSDAW